MGLFWTLEAEKAMTEEQREIEHSIMRGARVGKLTQVLAANELPRKFHAFVSLRLAEKIEIVTIAFIQKPAKVM